MKMFITTLFTFREWESLQVAQNCSKRGKTTVQIVGTNPSLLRSHIWGTIVRGEFLWGGPSTPRRLIRCRCLSFWYEKVETLMCGGFFFTSLWDCTIHSFALWEWEVHLMVSMATGCHGERTHSVAVVEVHPEAVSVVVYVHEERVVTEQIGVLL